MLGGGRSPDDCASRWSGSRTSSSTSAPTCRCRTRRATGSCGSNRRRSTSSRPLRPLQRGARAAEELRPARRERGRGPAARRPRRSAAVPSRRAPASRPVNPLALVYLNRLSDLLFILARAANARRAGAALEAWQLALGAAGSFAAGYLGSAIGLVLGTLRLPLMILLASSPASAAGTNIGISAASAAAGSVRHAREGRVSWPVVAWMLPPSVVGAFVGGYFGGDLPDAALLGVAAGILALQRPRPPRSGRSGEAAHAAPHRTGGRWRLRDRRARRGDRRHPRDDADARPAPRRRNDRREGGRDEPRRRLRGRQRRPGRARRAARGRVGAARRRARRRRSSAAGSART